MIRGRSAERRAERHLLDQGLDLLERNYRCRSGEIDLIVRDGETLVVVEVRERRDSTHGSAVESITAAKRRRIISATRHYLARRGDADGSPLRFDVIGIDGDGRIDWIRSAFEVDGSAA